MRNIIRVPNHSNAPFVTKGFHRLVTERNTNKMFTLIQNHTNAAIVTNVLKIFVKRMTMKIFIQETRRTNVITVTKYLFTDNLNSNT